MVEIQRVKRWLMFAGLSPAAAIICVVAAGGAHARRGDRGCP
jgi:hypothetical protein